MSSFKYTAKNSAGGVITGVMTARESREVVSRLRDSNMVALEVKPVWSGMEWGRTLIESGRRRGRVKKKDLVLFIRQLSTMISAGIPLLESLEILRAQAERGTMESVIGQLVHDIRAGADFSQSLERHPKIFSSIFISMVRAGEASGQMDTILLRLAEYMEASEKLRRDIKAAMTYPVISLVLIFGIAGFLMIGIIPKFQSIFESLGISLPGITQTILNVSAAMKEQWYFILAGIVGLCVGFSLFRKTDFGRNLTDWAILRLPIFGPLFRKVALSRFSRTLGTLIKSGVPILEALDIVTHTLGNRTIAKVVVAARENVRQGDTLSQPLSESPVFPPMVTKMIGIGEKSGAMETLLEKISQFYDDQVNAEVKSLTSVIEPLMIGIMGLIVGGIVLAVFLPIFKLQQQLASIR
jgi:type IV pilus assembly protein PilC